MRKYWKFLGAISITIIITWCFFIVALFSQKPDVISVPNFTPPNPNAFNSYLAATSDLRGDVEKLTTQQKGSRNSLTITELSQLVNENRRTFANLHKGLHEAYMSPSIRSFTTLLPYYKGFRNLARLLKMKADLEYMQGNHKGAFQTDLNTIQFGIQIQHTSEVIGMLVGVAVQETGIKDAWKHLNGLSYPDYLTFAHKLEMIDKTVYPFRKTVQEEEWTGIASLEEVFRHPEKLVNSKATSITHQALRDDLMSISLRIEFAAYGGLNGILKSYQKYMQSLSSAASSRYGLHAHYPKLPRDPINKMLCEPYVAAHFVYVRIKVDRDLMLLALELHAYHSQHSSYPQTLQQLVPAYLSSLPQDEFAAEGTYHYRLTGKSFLLYSVGPDGRDDGGKPIENVENGKKRFNMITSTSKGDIVAGVN